VPDVVEKVYCKHCWIEALPTKFTQVIGHDAPRPTWKHRFLQDEAGNGWCGKVVLREEDIESDPDATEVQVQD
jgi:hypothetical protein